MTVDELPPSMDQRHDPRGNEGRSEISWSVRLAIKPNQLTNFCHLTGEMVECTRAERGVLSYQRYVSADNQLVHLYERYSDSSAALAHLLTFRTRFAERFATMVDRRDFSVYGNPSDELKQVLGSFGAQFLTDFGGFRYWP